MASQQDLDRLHLAMHQAVVAIIDADPHRRGLRIARSNCARWLARGSYPAIVEWQEILERPWDEVRAVMLDPSDDGHRLRSSSPFAGVLTPRERWRLMERFREAS